MIDMINSSAEKDNPLQKETKVKNPMAEVKIKKVVINIGSGSDDLKQEDAKMLLKKITGRKPADAISRHRLPEFKISKGQKIGAFVTLRGKAARETLKKLLEAVDNKLSKKQVVDNAVNFGIGEYIDISGVKYDPKIGMLGMNVNVSFNRSGTRVAKRKRKKSIIKKRHRTVSREEIIAHLQKNFNVIVE